MEALGLPAVGLFNRCSCFHKPNVIKMVPSTPNFGCHWGLSSIKLKPSSTTRTYYSKSFIRVQADGEDYELKQMRDMAAARKRWETLLREGKVKVLTPREAGYAVQLSNKPLLDVRPSNEHKKAWVKGSTWIPIFDVDSNLDAGTLAKKVTNFVMGGWWSGMPTLSYDRSLAACEILYNAGYTNLFWVQGGLEAAEEEDLIVEGPLPLKFAGIGGVSEFLGWTEQQRAAAAKEGWGYRLVFSARLVGLILLADALFIGAQQAARYLQDIRSH
ncbi:rhodanese-like domain-containing protein 11, chloroplastic isoform X2 [Prosopis cineraria]|uniref:rhodanese-like domain-containing protein 11, chloroplastic isoform X2 n=1 Tax=Prosopis cineraria TaxID=364024 RepID=UPI00241066C4|nr:rhodanese-like domain-containing protein 11, chloroplastic isoform X2 [Prosopis cineraria]